MWALALAYFCFGYVAWMFFAWIYIYMAQARGLNLKTSALYSMLPFLAMTVGCLLGGVLSDALAFVVAGSLALVGAGLWATVNPLETFAGRKEQTVVVADGMGA